MTVGLVLGALAIRSSLKGPATVAMAAPVLIWAILLFDVGAAILRRKLTGQSVYTTDRGHLHHVLQKRGFSRLKIVTVVGSLCLICGLFAMLSVYQKSEAMAVAAGVTVIGSLIVSRLFGHSEFLLVAQRVRSLLRSMFRLPTRPRAPARPVVSRFTGDKNWEQLWEALLEFAEEFDLSLVQLNVNSPAIGEEYHAFWERKEHPPLLRMWRLEVPLFHGKLAVGRLFICGAHQEGATCTEMGNIVEALRPLEQQMRELLDSPAPPRNQVGSLARQKVAV
jgi:UDP-GlcNAc:undecaprenyl-phosphate GlcNAc-1-phosphate transferase